jgi:hypothetical protein
LCWLVILPSGCSGSCCPLFVVHALPRPTPKARSQSHIGTHSVDECKRNRLIPTTLNMHNEHTRYPVVSPYKLAHMESAENDRV